MRRMNAHKQTLVAGALFLAAMPLAVLAAEPSHRCAGQAEDAQRLACYDAAFGKPRATATGSSVPTPTPAVAATPAPVSAAVRPVELPAAPVKNQKPDSRKDVAAPNPTKVDSSIASLRRLRDNRYELTLANGEVWAQVEADPRAEMTAGDAITIRPALMGSFMMVTASGLRTRVKRVK
jgi:hypothetical protein